MNTELYELETLAYLKTLTLLCVEDNRTTQILYSSLLEEYVKDIIFASDGEDGYKKFSQSTIDIIITDYDMPKQNGLQMIQRIQEIDTGTPIIFVSTIEDVNVIVSAISLDVNSFVKKPINTDELIHSLEKATKLLIANQVLQKQKDKALYAVYQEDLGFAKELNILRNDFYYQMIESDTISLVDFLYQPLDILSGDAYCARCTSKSVSFYLMVDGMGKGLSASLTAMIMTSFVNHLIDRMLETDSFDLAVLIDESMKYIKPVLLEEESLSLDYVVIDDIEMQLYYAKFSMPVLLMEDDNNEIVRLKSNNPPLSKWQDTFNIDSYDISKISKFLIYSDGIVENETIHQERPYSDFIEEDFLNSFTREDLKKSFFEKITLQEDDISLVYIHKLRSNIVDTRSKVFDTSLNETESAGEWYENVLQEIVVCDDNFINQTAVVFTELFMNAYEHGNLEIDSELKHRLLENDTYFETLREKEQICSKSITVEINKIEHNNTSYIVTHISDEGEGFDTQILSEIFRNSETFNGRGVFISRKNSLGIYYNSKGNSVLFLNKVEKNLAKLNPKV